MFESPRRSHFQRQKENWISRPPLRYPQLQIFSFGWDCVSKGKFPLDANFFHSSAYPVMFARAKNFILSVAIHPVESTYVYLYLIKEVVLHLFGVPHSH